VLTAAHSVALLPRRGVRMVWSPALVNAPLLLWPWLNLTFGDAVAEILGPVSTASCKV
jgi:hypothetical protein